MKTKSSYCLASYVLLKQNLFKNKIKLVVTCEYVIFVKSTKKIPFKNIKNIELC